MTEMDFSMPNAPNTYSWAQMAPYLTWAIVQPDDSVNAHAAGIHTMMYTDPFRVNTTSPEYSNDESEYAHDCSGSRITFTDKPLTTWLTDPSSTTLAQLWAQQVQTEEQSWGGVFDMILEDNSDVVDHVSAMPCNFDQAAWSAATNALNTGLGSPIVFNGLGNLVDGPNQISPSIAVLASTMGGEIEGCYSNGDPLHPMPHNGVWQIFENTEIQVVASGKLLVCRGLSTLPDTTAQVPRLYMYASYLLTYSPDTSIFSDKFTPANNGFGVEPENQLVVKDPVTFAPTDISQLKTASGTYARQYKNCYYVGNWVGPCAVVVNSDSPTHPHLFPYAGQYHHTLVLNGGDILDGGTASASGPAPPTLMAPESAVIAFP